MKMVFWVNFATFSTKVLMTFQRGPLESDDFHENGEYGENEHLTKNRQKFTKYRWTEVRITSPSGHHESGDFDKKGEHDENRDLTKSGQKFNENSN